MQSLNLPATLDPGPYFNSNFYFILTMPTGPSGNAALFTCRKVLYSSGRRL